MSVQGKVEFRVSKIRLVLSAVTIGGFFLFITVFPLFAGEITTSVMIYIAVMTVAGLLVARYLFWMASLVYIVSDVGLTIRDNRGEKHLNWDDIVGVRRWPFVGDVGRSRYNLELRNGKTQKLHDVDDSLIDCLKFYLPQTKYWWSPE